MYLDDNEKKNTCVTCGSYSLEPHIGFVSNAKAVGLSKCSNTRMQCYMKKKKNQNFTKYFVNKLMII